MPNNPLTQAELSAYTSTFPYPQIPAGYFFASPPTGAGPLAYRLFDASYISIGIINPNRLGTGSTGAGTRYLADDGTWKLVSSISLPTPTLAQVTTVGNTTTNAITIGGLTSTGAAYFQNEINALWGVGELTFNRGSSNITPTVAVGNTNPAGKFASLVAGTVGSAFIYDVAGHFSIGSEPKSNYTSRTLGGSLTRNLLVFGSTGNIVIQTGGTFTDAGYKLDVNGTTRFTGDSYVAAGDFLLDNNRPIRWKDSGGTSRRAMLITAANDFQFGPVDTGWGATTYVKAGGALQLVVNGVSGTFATAVHISTAGSVGIGTTSPSEKLDVQGPIRLSSAINQSLNGFSRIYTSYNLAKGETYIEPEGSTTPTRFFPNGGVVIGTTTQQPPANGLLVTGNIGVGTVAPTYKIDVQGTTLVASSVRVQGSFDINPLAAPPVIGGFTLSAGTNLGVGTYYYMVVYVTALGETSAGANLTVVTTTGNTTVNLTGIPVSSDPRVTARKLYRTKVGGTTDNHWFLATISDNVTTTYTDSIADASLTGLGLQAYKINTTARYFTVSGVQGMVIDQNLTALGRNAGNAIITSNATAVRTVLIGANAGQNITTGTSNVIVGVAGGNVTTGSDNSLFGDLAGYNLNIGYGNIIVGAQAGRFLNSGYQNIFIGQGAGSYLTNGSTQVTTAFQNIAIGRNVRLSTINDSNSIIIGDTALGLGSNSTVLGNSSTTFTSIPAGNMTVGGTTNAGYKLDVQGTTRIQSNLTVSSDIIVGTDNITNAWIAYTPIWSSQGGTQPNLGDGTLTGFYKKIGKTVFVRVKLNFGLTTTGGDGAWLFSLPVNAASQDGIQFPCSMLDNGFAWYQGIVNGTYSGFTDKSAIIAQSPGGANSSQGVSGAFPFGWGNGDSLQFNGSYECI